MNMKDMSQNAVGKPRGAAGIPHLYPSYTKTHEAGVFLSRIEKN